MSPARPWNFLTADQAGGSDNRVFEDGAWGGGWHPDLAPQENDVVVREHWGQNGFAHTDLDLQLKKHGITHVVTVGMLANTCIESTSRHAMELGSHDLNGTSYAHAILSSDEIVTAFKGAHV
ncbi:isochorismatase family protein [Streptomyces canus]|uniref:isochorismatase family protein n=1 Tax=Streptomyces canus TaxID=58343 RepID=UPI0033ABD23C